MADFEGLLKRLIQHHVDFVIVGGYAAVAHGISYLTQDIDVCCSFEPDNLLRLLPDFQRIVLDPAGFGVDLFVFFVSPDDGRAAVVEEDAARAGCALVNGGDVFHSQNLQKCSKSGHCSVRCFQTGPTAGFSGFGMLILLIL